MSNQILSQVQILSLDEKRELLGLLDELEESLNKAVGNRRIKDVGGKTQKNVLL